MTGPSDGNGTNTDITTAAFDATTGAELWTALYNGVTLPNGRPSIEAASGAAVHPDRSELYVVANTSHGVAAIAYDTQTGTELWTSVMQHPSATGNEGGIHVELSPAGETIYAAVRLRTPRGDDFRTVAIDTETGALRWDEVYNGPAGKVDVPRSLVVSPDGARIYVTGESQGTRPGDFDFATVAYDAMGGKVWAARYDAGANAYEGSTAIGVSRDGKTLFVAGAAASVNTDVEGERVADPEYATMVIAYDASSGGEAWVRRDDTRRDVDPLEGVAPGLAVTGDYVLVTGATTVAGNRAASTAAYGTSDGAPAWSTTYSRGFDDVGRRITMSPDGGTVYVGGQGTTLDQDGFPASRPFTAAYSSRNGAHSWAASYAGSSAITKAVAVSNDGSAVFSGGERLLRYETERPADAPPDAQPPASCVELPSVDKCETYVATYTHPSAGGVSSVDAPLAMAVAPNGKQTYVTGASLGADSSYDIATVAFDQNTGKVLWTQRYDGGRNEVDAGFDVRLSRDGETLFVTGIENNGGSAGEGDFVTIAHEATTGDVLWTSTYDGPGQKNDAAYSVRVSPDDSRVFVTGHSDGALEPTDRWSGSTQKDIATVAYDAETGAELWIARYDGRTSRAWMVFSQIH